MIRVNFFNIKKGLIKKKEIIILYIGNQGMEKYIKTISKHFKIIKQ